MTILAIAQIGTPILREPAREVTAEELRSDAMQTFIDDLVETMRDANGAGLAATQVYRDVRICALEVATTTRATPTSRAIPLTILVNPVLTPLSAETFDNYEGCLSVPEPARAWCGATARSASRRWTATARRSTKKFAALPPAPISTRSNHLDGKLFVDRVTDTTTLCTWKAFARHREQEFRASVEKIVARYGS